MNDQQLLDILTSTQRIAPVGLSGDANKDSYGVGIYLIRAGYELLPVNPRLGEIHGLQCYASLLDVPTAPAIDLVQIFRPSAEAVGIVEQAIRIGARYVWMQEGISSDEAAELAQKAGLQVIMNRCMMEEHRRLIARPRGDLV